MDIIDGDNISYRKVLFVNFKTKPYITALWIVTLFGSLYWYFDRSSIKPILALCTSIIAYITILLHEKISTVRIYLLLLTYSLFFTLLSNFNISDFLLNLTSEIIGAIIILVIIERRTGLDEIQKRIEEERRHQKQKFTDLLARYREKILETIHSAWVKGVLEATSESQLWFEPNITYLPGIVESFLKTNGRNSSEQPLVLGTQIIDVFDEFGGKLLILGSFASGKTTLLLRIAKVLIERAKSDPNEPIPIVFNLGSWSSDFSSVADWLINEMRSKYQFRPDIAQYLIDNQQLLLLLDGLDEITTPAQEQYIAALNDFMDKRGLIKVVVTSRFRQEAFSNVKLKLNGAVMIQPLNQAQILEYLEQNSELKDLLQALDSSVEIGAGLLSLVAGLFRGIKLVPRNIQELYEDFILGIIRRELGKNRADKDELSAEQVLLFLKTTATTLSRENRHSFSEHDIKNSDKALLEIAVNSGLIHKANDSYSFSHISFMEMLSSNN